MTPDSIQLSHGGGGLVSRQLIENEILPRFGDGPLKGLPDGASLDLPTSHVVMTTDSYVVRPVEFPGGNIGSLAIHGTVNDLAVCGATPRWISLALILEEGLPLARLRTILDTIRAVSTDCGVTIATGDLKVVERGRCDSLYINTTGLGGPIQGYMLSPDRIQPGDTVLVSGPVGDHGMAVMAVREHLDFRDGPISDTGPVHRLVLAIADHAPAIHFMRDPTRGGLATVLNECVDGSRCDIRLKQADIPLDPRTQAAAELLGLDLLQVACEGRVIAVCDGAAADAVLAAWRRLPEGRRSARIGTVHPGSGHVTMETFTGGVRLLDTPSGELLPRIC